MELASLSGPPSSHAWIFWGQGCIGTLRPCVAMETDDAPVGGSPSYLSETSHRSSDKNCDKVFKLIPHSIKQIRSKMAE